MNKNRRNILIAVVLLVILLVMPFWGSIKGLITGEDFENRKRALLELI